MLIRLDVKIALLVVMFWACANVMLCAIDDRASKEARAIEIFDIKRIYKRIKKLENKIRETLKLPPEEMESLREKLAKVKLPDRYDQGAANETIQEINARTGIGKYLFQNDIFLTDSQADDIVKDIESEGNRNMRRKRQAFRNETYPNSIWKKGVYYYFHSNASADLKKEFKYAVSAWEADTCVNFTEISKEQSGSVEDYLEITTDYGCSSHVGKFGGWQPLSLGKGCESFGHIAHELGHALGLFHTMGRHDRDKYITVVEQNIDQEYLNEFVRQTRENNKNYGLGYDYGSIMHYRWTSGSRRHQKPTMIPKDIRYKNTLGSEMISFVDLTMINTHYKCKGKCKSNLPIKCENGGYPHPRNCSRCLCPGGYGGVDCTKRPPGCGEKLQAERKWNSFTGRIENRNPHKYLDGYHKCNYWIESPPKTRIQVKLGNVLFPKSDDGCPVGGVEIKTNRNHTLTGYRFCSHYAGDGDDDDDADDKIVLTSHSNRVPIISYSRDFFEGKFTLYYRYINESRS